MMMIVAAQSVYLSRYVYAMPRWLQASSAEIFHIESYLTVSYEDFYSDRLA